MTTKRRNIIILVGIAVVVAASLYANLGIERKDRTEVTVDDVEVATLVAKVSGPGKVRAETTVQISSSIMGRIVRLAVDEGDRVERGQFLLKLDDVWYRSQVDQADARVERARAQLATAARDYADIEEQFAKGLSFEKERDELRALAATYRQNHQEALAALEAARDQLEKTEFTSPIDGVVTRLNVEEGENVVTGTMNAPGTVIMTISDLSHMEVEVEIDETDIVDVRLSQEAEIDVDALADTVLTGRVTEVGNSGIVSMGGTQEEVTNFLVKVLVNETHPSLKPGMSATVEIVTAVHDSVLNVPIQSVVARTPSELKSDDDEEDEKSEKKRRSAGLKDEEEIEGVFVVDENDQAAFVPVTTGIADELSIEIAGDLTAGQSVISGPYRELRNLKSGADLKVREENGESKNDKTKKAGD